MGDPWGAEGFTETLPSPFTGQISTNYLFGEIQSLFSLITLMALFAFDIWLLRFKSTKIQLLFKGKVKSLSCVRLFATPWTAAHQAPPSVGFFRQEYWNGLPFPSPGDLPDPGIKPRSPALQADILTSEPPTLSQFFLLSTEKFQIKYPAEKDLTLFQFTFFFLPLKGKKGRFLSGETTFTTNEKRAFWRWHSACAIWPFGFHWMGWMRLPACQGRVSWVSRCNFHSFSSRVRWPITALTSSHWLCGSSCLEREFQEARCAQDLPFLTGHVALPALLLQLFAGPCPSHPSGPSTNSTPQRGPPWPLPKGEPPVPPGPPRLCFLHSIFKSVLLPLSLLINP